MAWSTVYTQSYSGTADSQTFLEYFFDTHLPTKNGWNISAHPSGLAYQRSVELSLPSPWLNGANASCYFWVNWATSSTPNGWVWYQDATYTSVPGDLGTDSTNSWTSSTAWPDFGGDWRIWESSTDPEGVLVTKGRAVIFYWPGPSVWSLRVDQNWDGTTDDVSSSYGPYIGQNYGNLMCGNYPTTTAGSSNEYSMTVDTGVGVRDYSGMSGGPYWLIAGVQWMTSSTSAIPDSTATVAIPRTGADTAWFLPDANTVTARYICTSSNTPWALLFESNTSSYWLLGTSDLNKQALALNMGSSEPDFS